jgi:sugar lactone lactonase YvrE
MGLSEGPDGSLYISESKNGRIWRVFFAGDKTQFGAPQLEAMEKRKSRTYVKVPEEKTDLIPVRQ